MCLALAHGAAGAIGGAAGGFIVVGLMPLGMVGLAVVLVRRKGRGREREAEGRHFGADGLLVGVVAALVAWLIVPPGVNMWAAMAAMMPLGMVIGLALFFPIGALLGADAHPATLVASLKRFDPNESRFH